MISIGIDTFSLEFSIPKTYHQFQFFRFDFPIEIPVRSLQFSNPFLEFICLLEFF